jgi:ABC-type hemin transport system ATPase subunit
LKIITDIQEHLVNRFEFAIIGKNKEGKSAIVAALTGESCGADANIHTTSTTVIQAQGFRNGNESRMLV